MIRPFIRLFGINIACLWICTSCFCLQGLAQSKPFTSGQEEYFLGHLPSMRAEAMGKAQVALSGDILMAYTNPASISTIQSRNLSISSSGPFYVLGESDYGFLGYAQRINSTKWVGGAAVRGFWIGPTTFEATINGQKYELENARMVNTSVSLAREVLPGLHVGLNANLYRLQLFSSAKIGTMPHFDVGLLYKRELANNQRIQVGASLNNFLIGQITYNAPNGDFDLFYMPSVLRVGASYTVQRDLSIGNIGTGPINLLFTLEGQDFVNSDYYTALRFGAEAEIWNLLVLRLGAFRMTKDDGGIDINYDLIRDITYGFGFIVPLDQLHDWPVRLYVDYTSLQQARQSDLLGRQPNMRGVSLRLVWILNAQN